ncbi:hypothetical protein HHL28_06585 [Aerophototrophica crusticola]|uniref:Uncharacterized protein n=1 Tax=Aerophototrophica crusticola TaxID=1709002 RepID=A0A858R5X1_9PROT|nr:hypothetical protein HHL28_06585 [Rhodospirillaceae bacterium B3]
MLGILLAPLRWLFRLALFLLMAALLLLFALPYAVDWPGRAKTLLAAVNNANLPGVRVQASPDSVIGFPPRLVVRNLALSDGPGGPPALVAGTAYVGVDALASLLAGGVVVKAVIEDPVIHADRPLDLQRVTQAVSGALGVPTQLVLAGGEVVTAGGRSTVDLGPAETQVAALPPPDTIGQSTPSETRPAAPGGAVAGTDLRANNGAVGISQPGAVGQPGNPARPGTASGSQGGAGSAIAGGVAAGEAYGRAQGTEGTTAGRTVPGSEATASAGRPGPAGGAASSPGAGGTNVGPSAAGPSGAQPGTASGGSPRPGNGAGPVGIAQGGGTQATGSGGGEAIAAQGGLAGVVGGLWNDLFGEHPGQQVTGGGAGMAGQPGYNGSGADVGPGGQGAYSPVGPSAGSFPAEAGSGKGPGRANVPGGGSNPGLAGGGASSPAFPGGRGPVVTEGFSPIPVPDQPGVCFCPCRGG